MSTPAISALEKIRQIDSKITLEEAAGDERARAIPEWRHQVRYYAPAAIGLLFVFVLLPLMAFGIRALYRWLAD